MTARVDWVGKLCANDRIGERRTMAASGRRLGLFPSALAFTALGWRQFESFSLSPHPSPGIVRIDRRTHQTMLIGHPIFWILVAAVAAPLLSEIPLGFKVPVVVIEVVLGIVIGPHILG